MGSIYRISNNVNDKVYIGYTSRQNVQRRFYEHCYDAIHKAEKDNSILHKAMNKYGIDKFQFDVIYQFDEKEEDWQEVEKYYISLYNSINPNGYNIMEGGEKPPIHYGENNNKSKIKDIDLPLLYNSIQNNKISYKEIAQQFNISVDQLYRINTGKARYNCLLSYPLRKYNKYEEQALQIIELLKNNITLTNTEIGQQFGIRPNEVASINQGKKYQYLYDGEYPIRKIVVPNDLQIKQQKAYKIRQYIQECEQNNIKWTQKGIQQLFNYSRNAVEKTINNIYPYSIIPDYIINT